MDNKYNNLNYNNTKNKIFSKLKIQIHHNNNNKNNHNYYNHNNN